MQFVYFGAVDWGYTWQRPQQLATRLARRARVLYVNPLGLRPPAVRDLGRLLGRLAARRRTPGAAGDRAVRVHTAWLSLPFPGRPAATRWNAWQLRRAIARWRRPAADPLVLWAGTPAPVVLALAEAMPEATLVYDCLDEFAAFYPSPEVVARVEARLAAAADVVFATAAGLEARMRELNPRTVRLPNGADWEHFARAREQTPSPPPELAGLARPILGYVGELARWFDVDLVDRLSRERPGWQIVLIGHRHVDAPGLLARPNVHGLGPRPYAALPAYLGGFDVGLLPFRVDRLTAAVDPIKIYEYLAAGKPVVSTDLPEVRRHGDLVRIAGPAEFAAAVEAALAEADDPARLARRLAVAREHGWDRRADAVFQALALHARSAGRRGRVPAARGSEAR